MEFGKTFVSLGYMCSSESAMILEEAYFVQVLHSVFYLCSFSILFIRWVWIFKMCLSIGVFFSVSHHNFGFLFISSKPSLLFQNFYLSTHSTIFDLWISRLHCLRPHHNPPSPPVPLCHHQPTHLLLSLLHHLHRSAIRSWRLMAGVSSASHTMRPYECWSLHTTWWWRWRMSDDCRMPAP